MHPEIRPHLPFSGDGRNCLAMPERKVIHTIASDFDIKAFGVCNSIASGSLTTLGTRRPLISPSNTLANHRSLSLRRSRFCPDPIPKPPLSHKRTLFLLLYPLVPFVGYGSNIPKIVYIFVITLFRPLVPLHQLTMCTAPTQRRYAKTKTLAP